MIVVLPEQPKIEEAVSKKQGVDTPYSPYSSYTHTAKYSISCERCKSTMLPGTRYVKIQTKGGKSIHSLCLNCALGLLSSNESEKISTYRPITHRPTDSRVRFWTYTATSTDTGTAGMGGYSVLDSPSDVFSGDFDDDIRIISPRVVNRENDPGVSSPGVAGTDEVPDE